MPIYSYKCEEGHETDLLREFSTRKDPAECRCCQKEAKYFFNISSKKIEEDPHEMESNCVKIIYRHGKPKKVYFYRDVNCFDCEKVSYVDCSTDNEYDPSVAQCDFCDSKNVEVLISVPSIDRFGERFPYYDRGLGMTLHSKAHRREVCRKLGVEPVDGDIDMAEEANKVKKTNESSKKEYDKINHNMKHHPGYKEYRRLKDRGWKPNYKHRRQR